MYMPSTRSGVIKTVHFGTADTPRAPEMVSVRLQLLPQGLRPDSRKSGVAETTGGTGESSPASGAIGAWTHAVP